MSKPKVCRVCTSKHASEWRLKTICPSCDIRADTITRQLSGTEQTLLIALASHDMPRALLSPIGREIARRLSL